MKKRSVITNFFWRFAERCGAQGVAFVVQIVLARLLAPEAYGVIALITVFTSILNVFIDSGMANALIQKKNSDDVDFSSVFYFNIAVCSILYLIMFFASPLIAEFYDDSSLVPVIRVLSLTLVVSGVKNVQQAYVSKNLQFKRFFFATLGGTLGAAALGITLAYLGFGVWALVAQHLFNTTVDTMILWITVKWRPKRVFSLKRLKGLFSYGWKLLVSSLIDVVYNNMYQLIIGKFYSKADLAFFNRGKQFPEIFTTNINASIDSVLLPTMAKEQDDKTRVKSMTRRAIKTSTFIMAPIMIGLIAIGTPLVRLLLTEKWLPCIIFLNVFCITFMFYPIHTANLNAIKAMGRSDYFLVLEIIKKCLGISVLLITIWHGLTIMSFGMLFTGFASQIINSWPNKKLLSYGYLEQLKDIIPGILIAVFMGGCIYPIQFIGLPDIVTLCIQVPLGAVIYIAASKLFKLESFTYLWGMVKPVLKKVFGRKKNAGEQEN